MFQCKKTNGGERRIGSDTFSNSNSKIWDAYSGNSLHSFPHNHIVRSVALSPTAEHLLTGGQEKKARIFHLARPDAPPEFLGGESNTTCHDGTIKSVVWTSENIAVTAGEDGNLKCVANILIVCGNYGLIDCFSPPYLPLLKFHQHSEN